MCETGPVGACVLETGTAGERLERKQARSAANAGNWKFEI
jgi:hypothetical protein